MEEILKAYSESDPNATIARIDNVERIDSNIISQEDTKFHKTLKNRHLIINMCTFGITGIDRMEYIFKSKIKTVFSFTRNKMVQLIYEGKKKFVIIKSIFNSFAEIDFILNSLYCDDNPDIVVNIQDIILYKIINNSIDKITDKQIIDVDVIKKLYWLNLRIVDTQLSSIMSSGGSRVIAYCLVFDNTIILFNNTKKGRLIYILDYPKNCLIPFRDLE